MDGSARGVSGLLQGLVAARSSRNVGKVLLIVTAAVCIYQAWRRWYAKRIVVKRIRGKVVLITGASSGLGEGKHYCYVCIAFDIYCTVLQHWPEFSLQWVQRSSWHLVISSSWKVLNFNWTMSQERK